LWVIFALLDPDPENPDSESGSGSTDPIESGSGSETLAETCQIFINRDEIDDEVKNLKERGKVLVRVCCASCAKC
jgi:hypothetical protein